LRIPRKLENFKINPLKMPFFTLIERYLFKRENKNLAFVQLNFNIVDLMQNVPNQLRAKSGSKSIKEAE